MDNRNKASALQLFLFSYYPVCPSCPILATNLSQTGNIDNIPDDERNILRREDALNPTLGLGRSAAFPNDR